MRRSPPAVRITLAAAALVLVAGIVSASIPGLFAPEKRPVPPVAAPATSVPGTTVPSTSVPPTTVPAPASTTLPAAPSTTSAPARASSGQAFVPASQSKTLARTGPPTRNLLAGGIALVLLGGVLVLSQQPDPYAPRHLHRSRRPRPRHMRKKRSPRI